MRATALFGLVLCGTLAAGTATLRGALPQASDAVMLQQGVSLRAGAGVAAGDIGGKMQALEAKIRAELAHAQHAEEEHKRQAEAVLGRVREAVAALEKEDDAAHNQVVLLEAQVAPLEAEDASMLQRIKDAEHAADEKREQITRGQQERNAEAAQFAHVREELVESIAQTQQLEEAIQSALSHAAVADAVSHAQQDGVVALLQVGAERRDSATLHRLALLARSGFKAAQEGNSETVQQMVELLHRLRSSLRASLEEQEAREERAKEAWQHIMVRRPRLPLPAPRSRVCTHVCALRRTCSARSTPWWSARRRCCTSALSCSTCVAQRIAAQRAVGATQCSRAPRRGVAEAGDAEGQAGRRPEPAAHGAGAAAC